MHASRTGAVRQAGRHVGMALGALCAAAAAFAQASAPFDQGLLWRVEKPGGTQGDGPYRYYAKGDDLVLIANGNAVVSPAPSAGAWVLVLDSTTSDAGTYRPGSNHTVGTGFVSTTGFPIPGWDNNTIASDFAGNIATPVDQWAGVRFDGSGRVTGVVDLTGGGTGTSALAKTCWTSFSGFKAYPG